MFAATFNSEAVFILDNGPDWLASPQADFTLWRDTEAGLTKREARRAYSATLRTTLKYNATVNGAALRSLQAALRALTVERVIVPFWPAQTAWSVRGSSGLAGGLRVVWKEDWSQYEVYAATDAEPSWPVATDNFAPALMGWLAPALLEFLNADAATWPVEFSESASTDYALGFATDSGVVSPPTPNYDDLAYMRMPTAAGRSYTWVPGANEKRGADGFHFPYFLGDAVNFVATKNYYDCVAVAGGNITYTGTLTLLRGIATFTDGPLPAGYSAAPKLLPFQPDFTRVRDVLRVDVAGEQLGFNREEGRTFYPHAAYRSQTAGYTLQAGGIAELLYFFAVLAAPGDSFWSPGWLAVLKLTSAALTTDTVLNVESDAAVNVGDYVSIFTLAGTAARKVTAKGGTNITLDTASGLALTPEDTRIFPLALARLDKPSLRVSWNNAEVATAEWQWTEVRTETVLPGDETLAATIGRLPSRAVLFQFTRDLRNGTTLNYYFTSYEEDVSWNGQTWTSARWQCGDITRSLNLENDGVEISSFHFTGNPLLEDVTKRAEAPLRVKIYFAEL